MIAQADQQRSPTQGFIQRRKMCIVRNGDAKLFAQHVTDFAGRGQNFSFVRAVARFAKNMIAQDQAA